jgi:hypothetical protein
MNDAAQIRRSSGALHAKHSRLRLSPPPAPHPNLEISNREPLRLRINVTQTKQTPELFLRRGGPLAPPDLRPSFRPSSLRPPPTRDPNLKNSNREALRRVRADDSARRNNNIINVTQTKQTPATHSNREKEALFSKAGETEKRAGLKARPYNGNGEQNSNREALRRDRADDSARRYIVRAVNRLCDCRGIDRLRDCGEIDRQLKNSNRESAHSNREESHAFQIPINPTASTTRNRGQLHSQIPNFLSPKKTKSLKNHPQSLFRIEHTSTVYFQQLTRNLNEPMFRLEHHIFTIPESRVPVAHPLLAVSDLAIPLGTLLDPGRKTNLRSATHAYSIDERRWR